MITAHFSQGTKHFFKANRTILQFSSNNRLGNKKDKSNRLRCPCKYLFIHSPLLSSQWRLACLLIHITHTPTHSRWSAVLFRRKDARPQMGHTQEWGGTGQHSAHHERHLQSAGPPEGERFVVMAAGTEDGFVEESYLCFTARNKSGDYHVSFTQNFQIRSFSLLKG